MVIREWKRAGGWDLYPGKQRSVTEAIEVEENVYKK